MATTERPDYTRRAVAAGLALAASVGVVALIRRRPGRGPALPGETGDVQLFDLQAAAFPEQSAPDVAVVLPPRFDPSAPLRVCVYFRGFSNCAENVVASGDGVCSLNGPTRNASHLAQQLADSGANVVLVVPELRFDARSSDPGAIGTAEGFRAMMDEILGRHLAPVVGPRSLADVAHLSVMAHSGGYLAAAAVVRARPRSLRSVVLLDALYAADGDFARWVTDNAASFTPGGGFRFGDVYTRNGGTADRSAALLQRIRPSLEAAGAGASVLDADLARTVGEPELRSHAVVFQQSRLGHEDVSREYPRRFWAAGW